MNNQFFRKKFNQSNSRVRFNNALLLLLVIVLLISTVVLLSIYISASSYRQNSDILISRYANAAASDALQYASNLTSAIQSDTSYNLAMVRQNIYLLDRLNDMNLRLSNSLLVPLDALQIIYEDLDRYNRTIQTGTSSTMEVRTTLVNHLTSLQYLLSQ